jgi:LmbE family N-acetylglucosaminyl deacetylase
MSGPGTPGRVTPVNDLPAHGAFSLNLSTPAKILAIGAHPDDIEFGCGGTLAKWAAGGAVLHHLVLTDGAKGTWDPDREQAELIAERQAEQRQAAALLGGADVTFLGYPDGELHNDEAVRREVVRVMRLVQADVVLTHDPWRRYRLHPDHRHAGFIVTDALVAARDPHFFPDVGPAPHRPNELLLWEADEPNHVEDVGDVVAIKAAALLAHRSQLESTMGLGDADPVDAFESRLRGQLSAHGALAGIALGESFHRMTEL